MLFSIQYVIQYVILVIQGMLFSIQYVIQYVILVIQGTLFSIQYVIQYVILVIQGTLYNIPGNLMKQIKLQVLLSTILMSHDCIDLGDSSPTHLYCWQCYMCQQLLDGRWCSRYSCHSFGHDHVDGINRFNTGLTWNVSGLHLFHW